MNTFLELVAQDILQKYGTDLSRIAVVFPNKRASLFLNDALARLSQRPIWSPVYITISELFRRHSQLQVADNIKLICDLHRVYTHVTGYNESLDHFYGWGQLLLTDFDDIDKNMAPAMQVFTNLSNIHELDDTSYLNEEQRAIIRKFFANFSETHSSELKERFLRLWSNMGSIYHEYNEHLRHQNLAYEGALYRQVAEDEGLSFEYDHYIFVGFNLMQQVEKCLIANLKRQGKATVYSDDEHIAPQEITFVAAPTENIQARYATQWLHEGNRIADGRRTAIVLCDESLLGTVIHCLPPEVEHANVTTGYPLLQAPIASFIQQFLNLHTLGYDTKRRRFRSRYVKEMLRHPYAQYLDCDQLLMSLPDNASLLRHGATLIATLAKAIAPTASASPQSSASSLPISPFTAETLFRAYTLLNRLVTLVEAGDLIVDTITLQRLITQLIQQTSVPFHGEPAIGLQIMGVLETRNLDFDHVLLLSTNEGNMPRGINDASFIPYSIRKAFGLTTIDNTVSIYEYYFKHILSRAHDVTLCYNNATTDGHTGEMSRFMLQLLVESTTPIQQLVLQGGQHIVSHQPRPIDKKCDVINALRRRFTYISDSGSSSANPSPLLTPTAINRYMRCPVQFYYNYVEGLREPDDNDEDVIDNRVFGNIFHDAAQLLYEKMMQKSATILASDIDSVLKEKVDIERSVDAALQRHLFDKGKSSPSTAVSQAIRLKQLNGLQLINREVIIQYLRKLLILDRQLTPFTILGLEEDVVLPYTIHSIGINTTLGGRIDRLDMITDDHGADLIRVVDYKTGSRRLTALKDVDDIFNPSQLRNHNDYYLQALLYARLVTTSMQLSSYLQRNTPVAPALLFIQHAGVEGYDPILRFGQTPIKNMATPEGDHFVELLTEKIEEIFNPDIAFVPTEDRDRCIHCPYASFCGIQNV